MEELKFTNPELLKKKGLQLKENDDGTVTFVPYEEPLENGGKWLPESLEHYYSFVFAYEKDILLNPVSFTFKKDGFDRRQLKCGLVFPEKSIADKIAEQVNDLYRTLKEEYWNNYGSE